MKLSSISRKDCRKYLRLEYELPVMVTPEFISRLEVFGEKEVLKFSHFSSKSRDLYKIRNYESCFELAGAMGDSLLTATFRVKDENIVEYLEEEISSILEN